MKVSELNPPELDYWVAKAEGFAPVLRNGVCSVDAQELRKAEPAKWIGVLNGKISWTYEPSTSWSQGGPIIEREDIETGIGQQSEAGGGMYMFNPDKPKERWANCHGYVQWAGEGQILIAAMRAYVASKFGEEVD